MPEGKYGWIGNDTYPGVGGGPIAARNNTYKALRIIGEGYNLLYTVWCTGEKEYYDVEVDPDQMVNYLGKDSAALQSPYRLAGRPFNHVVSRLDSLLMVLKSCKAEECHEPWKTLHPKGSVKTLKQALDEDLDAFYEEQPRVSFSSCELGYLVDAEGPQKVNEEQDYENPMPNGRQQSFKYQGHWSWWT